MNKSSIHGACRPENLTLFHYGELDATGRLQVERHLKECSACRKELARLGKILGVLPKKRPEISPEKIISFNERVNRSIRPNRIQFFKPVLGWSFAAAATVLLLIIMLPSARGPQQPAPAIPLQMISTLNRMPETEMLLNLELLQNLDLLQELEETEASG